MYAMKLCRTVLGSLSFSCFCMRQRVIYKIFNKLAVDGQRVYLEVRAALGSRLPSRLNPSLLFVRSLYVWGCPSARDQKLYKCTGTITGRL